MTVIDVPIDINEFCKKHSEDNGPIGHLFDLLVLQSLLSCTKPKTFSEVTKHEQLRQDIKNHQASPEYKQAMAKSVAEFI